MWLLLGLACDFSASSTIVGVDTGGGDTASPADDTATDDSGGDDTETHDTAPPNPLEVDDDGDGASEMDGDCDDEDVTVFPGATDVCNGVDDDCDRDVDEDADPDAYEPNDTDPAYIGSLDDDPEYTVVATLAGDDDDDRFSFAFTDETFDFFTVTVTLSGIPADATYRLTLNRLASNGDLPVEEVDQVFGTDSLSVSLEDVTFQDDGGTYEIVVDAIAGADCGQSYLLAVAK
jgi:hypothetical protein